MEEEIQTSIVGDQVVEAMRTLSERDDDAIAEEMMSSSTGARSHSSYATKRRGSIRATTSQVATR